MSVSTKNHEMTLRMLADAIQDSIAHRFAGKLGGFLLTSGVVM